MSVEIVFTWPSDNVMKSYSIRYLRRSVTQLFQLYCALLLENFRVGRTLFFEFAQAMEHFRRRCSTECNCSVCFNTEEFCRACWRLVCRCHVRPTTLVITQDRKLPKKRTRKDAASPSYKDMAADITELPLDFMQPYAIHPDLIVAGQQRQQALANVNVCTDLECLSAPIRNFVPEDGSPRTTPSMFDMVGHMFCPGFKEGVNSKCYRGTCEACPYKIMFGPVSEEKEGTSGLWCPEEHSATRTLTYQHMLKRSQPNGYTGLSVVEKRTEPAPVFFASMTKHIATTAAPHMYIDSTQRAQRKLLLARLLQEECVTTAHFWIDFPAKTVIKPRAAPTAAKYPSLHNLTAVVTFFCAASKQLRTVTYYALGQEENNHFFVRNALRAIIVEFREKYMPDLYLGIVGSDAGPKHFKSQFNYHLTSKLMTELSLLLLWYFGAPGEGKGPPDEEVSPMCVCAC